MSKLQKHVKLWNWWLSRLEAARSQLHKLVSQVLSGALLLVRHYVYGRESTILEESSHHPQGGWYMKDIRTPLNKHFASHT